MSQALAALVEQVQGMSADRLLEETTWGEAAAAASSASSSAPRRGGGGRGRERVSKEDYLLLAEAINLYFQAAPVSGGLPPAGPPKSGSGRGRWCIGGIAGGLGVAVVGMGADGGW